MGVSLYFRLKIRIYEINTSSHSNNITVIRINRDSGIFSKIPCIGLPNQIRITVAMAPTVTGMAWNSFSVMWPSYEYFWGVTPPFSRVA
jgi:hypothetical protein